MSLQTLFEGDVFKQTKIIQVGAMSALNMNNDTMGDIANNGNLVNGVTIEDGRAFTLTDDPPINDLELSNKKYVDDEVALGGVWDRTINDIAPKVAGGILNIDNIVEETPAAGILIDSVLIKDNEVSPNVLNLPATLSSSSGVINLAAQPFIHQFGGSNVFVGTSNGNFTLTGNAARNVGVGQSNLLALTDGKNNIGVGNLCLNR